MKIPIGIPRCAILCVCALATVLATVPSASRAEYELLVFTYRSSGVCAPCDRARPVLARLTKEYPIRFCYVENAATAAVAKAWRVDRFPTFLLVKTTSIADALELARWTGAERLEERVRALFSQIPWRKPPRKPSPGPAPWPSREPKPKPQPPRPKPRPVVPPPHTPPTPAIPRR